LPKIKRTEIIGNTITFYDGKRKVLGSHPYETEKDIEQVAQINELRRRFGYNELADAYANMQGEMFKQVFEQMISDAKVRDQFVEYDNQYATIRKNLSDFIPETTGSSVILLDRNISKVVAIVNYDERDKITSSTYYGYEKVGAPILNATKTEQLLQMPSGAEVWQITSSKIQKLNFKLKN
jgi:hypothetical protein